LKFILPSTILKGLYMALPANFSYGTVVGQYLAAIADGSDPDKLPEGVPMVGTVTFISSATYVLDYTSSPNPTTIMSTPIVCSLDTNGYLCSPYVAAGSPLSPGVSLVATDDPYLQPAGWTWTAMFNLTDPLGNRANLPSQSFYVPTGTTVDLTTVMNVAQSGGTVITKGDPNVLSIGTISTTAPGSSASATITGTSPAQVLSLSLPQGNPGPSNILSIGTVSTLAAGASATSNITGTSPAQVLNLGIPQGIQGIQGNPGDMVAVATNAAASGTITLTSADYPSTKLWTLTGNVTLVLPTPASTSSATITIVMTQDATGSRVITWPASVKWPDGIAQQPATAAGTVSMFNLLWTGTTWLGMLGGKSFA
jgi:hypothetical protein